jgi:hypothetical protein
MMNLRTRVCRLEAQREASGHCLLCQLILQTAGMPVARAAALARHTAHTFDEIVLESMRPHRPAMLARALSR